MPAHMESHPMEPGFVWDSNIEAYRPAPQPAWVTDQRAFNTWANTEDGRASIAAALVYGSTFPEQEDARVALAASAGVPYLRQTYPGENVARLYAAALERLGQESAGVDQVDQVYPESPPILPAVEFPEMIAGDVPEVFPVAGELQPAGAPPEVPAVVEVVSGETEESGHTDPRLEVQIEPINDPGGVSVPVFPLLAGIALLFLLRPAGRSRRVLNPRRRRIARRRRRLRDNPTKQTYYRRAVHEQARARLDEIAESIRGAQTEMTGKAFRDEHGEVVGRGRGIMPSLGKSYPEVSGWPFGPAKLLKTIRGRKTPAYFDLLRDAEHEVEILDGDQLELFVMGAPRTQLKQLPPIVYPPHSGTAKCKHCPVPHPPGQHRSHLKGSFDRTHPGAEIAALRKQRRDEQKARLVDVVPF